MIENKKNLLSQINKMLEFEDLSRQLEGMLITVKEELEVEIEMYKNKDKYLEKAKELSKNIKNIQLGCGKNILKNFINIDINKEADVYWDVREGLPFDSNSMNTIFSEHFYEHLDYPFSANTVISESYRILEVGGKIIIGIPDCDLPISAVINNDVELMKNAKEKWYSKREEVISNMNTTMDYLNYVMRDQLYDNKYHPHYWGYNQENLTFILKKHGFKNIKKWIPDLNIINPKREWGTLYLIAEK